MTNCIIRNRQPDETTVIRSKCQIVWGAGIGTIEYLVKLWTPKTLSPLVQLKLLDFVIMTLTPWPLTCNHFGRISRVVVCESCPKYILHEWELWATIQKKDKYQRLPQLLELTQVSFSPISWQTVRLFEIWWWIMTAGIICLMLHASYTSTTNLINLKKYLKK